MNKFKKFNIALMVGIAGFASSCEKYFEGVNDDPNRPTAVTPDLLLPSTQAFLAYGNAGDLARFTSLFMQQVTGVDRQFATYQVYNVAESDMDNWWRFNMYGGAFYDLHDIILQAEAAGQPQYAGVAKVLMAYGLMTATDVMGDIPYSDAFKAKEGNTKPTFDTQEEIYNTVMTLLSEGKAQLSEPAAPIAPGDEDLVYGGDVDLWIKTANVLSARAHLHLGNVDASHYGLALSALGAEGTDSYGSNGEDAIFNFGVDPTSAAPWSQYIGQRDDIDYIGYIYDTMAVLGDPRAAVYVDGSGSLGAPFSNADAPFYFASYMEQKFIEAEAAFQTNDLARAASAHNAGVAASLARYSIVDPTYVAAQGSETSGTITLEKIMVQKYIAMFLEPEVFVDWRRTGFPRLRPVAGNITSGVIPRRLPYPQSERIYNGGNVPSVPSITSKVWWDQ